MLAQVVCCDEGCLELERGQNLSLRKLKAQGQIKI